MIPESEKKFLANLRRALGHAPDVSRGSFFKWFDGTCSRESRHLVQAVGNNNQIDRTALINRLVAAAELNKMKVIPVSTITDAAQAIADLVRCRQPEWGDRKQVCAWRHELIDEMNLGEVLTRQQVPVIYPDDIGEEKQICKTTLRQAIIDSYVGITSADFCVADIAAIVMRTRPLQLRSISLVPSIHVAVVRADQILPDLKTLYAVLRWDKDKWAEGLTNGMTFVTGPSKTADIEATLVHGAHGPKEVVLIIIT